MAIKTIIRKATPKELEEARKRLEKKQSKIVQTEKPTPANP